MRTRLFIFKSLKKGVNEKAFDYMIEKYHRMLYAYTITLISDEDIAKEILQKTYIKVWKNRGR